MYLNTLYIEHCRNLTAVDLELAAGFNYFAGANGAGKTALLEAVHLLARGRSFRTQKTATVIQHAAESLLIRATLSADSGERHQIAMSKSRSGATELRIDGVSERKISETARLLPVQTLLPSAPELVLGGPPARRAFLDWGLFHVEPGFLDVSRRYRRLLSQRNAWLKGADDAVIAARDPWMNQLVELSIAVSRARAAYIEDLRPHFSAALTQLSPQLDIELDMDWGGLTDSASAAKKLGESFPRDVKFGVTHRGPHRADLLFLSSGKNAADTASRGQAKLIASAVILAQAEHLYARRRQRSLFLIDDFGAELDPEHWRRFTQTLVNMECQVLATSATPPGADWLADGVQPRMFHVKQGEVFSTK